MAFKGLPFLFPVCVARLVFCRPAVSPSFSCPYAESYVSFSSSSSLPPRVYQVLREPGGAGLCVSPLTVLLLPGMPLSAALCLFSKYSSLRSDWGHLLYESFPQMPCVFFLLPCSRVYRWLLFALRSGIPSSPPITLLETFVYISPLPARL